MIRKKPIIMGLLSMLLLILTNKKGLFTLKKTIKFVTGSKYILKNLIIFLAEKLIMENSRSKIEKPKK